jgi:tetratricopeptide (TPR) repeat protein
MSRAKHGVAGAAALWLAGAMLLPAAPAAADDYDTCLGSSSGAIDACTRVINSSRSSRDHVGNAYIGRGQHYYEKDAYDRAIADFDRAIPYQPKWLQLAYGNRGNAYAMKGQNDKAIDSYSVAISLDKNYSAAFTGRGLLYEKAGENEKARDDYEAALKAKSIFQDEKWAKETARKHLDDLGSASASNSSRESSSSSNAAAGDYNICIGSTAEAIDACSRVIASSQSTRDQVGNAYIGRGQHYYEKDDYDRAIADFDKAIPLKPKWLQLAYGNRGNAYAMKKQDQDAIDSYDSAISLDTNYSAAFTGRGLIYEKMGLVERARGDYEAALKAHSTFQDEQWAHDTARQHLDDLKDK